METLIPFLILCFGLFLGLAFPIVITFVLVYCLRKLDARWQREAKAEHSPVPKPECWNIKACSAKQRKACLAFTTRVPCWQVFRYPNGYLREECMACKVFLDAPIPKMNVDLRRA